MGVSGFGVVIVGLAGAGAWIAVGSGEGVVAAGIAIMGIFLISGIGVFYILGAFAIGMVFVFEVVALVAVVFMFAMVIYLRSYEDDEREKLKIIHPILPIIMIISAYVSFSFFESCESENRTFSVLIALVLIPIFNAVFDWLSIGLTRYLLRRNLSDASGIQPTVRSFIDFGGATILLLLLAVTLVVSLTLVDQIGYAKGMTTAIVGVDGVLADILLEPAATQHWWIYFTLFSTLIPTFIHGVIWVGSLSSVRPKIVDQWILREMNEVAATEDPEDRVGHARRAAAVVLMQWTIATFLVGAACHLIWSMTDHLTGAGEAFLTLLIWVQEMTAAGAAWVLW